MDILIGLFIVIVIIGALAGGKSFGSTIVRGIAVLVVLPLALAFLAGLTEEHNNASQVQATQQPLRTAEVIKVVDGDTVHISLDGNATKARLRCIDAPESDQPHGRIAHKHLEELVGGKAVRIEGDEIDRYGRLLLKLYHDDSNTSANWRMVRNGYAWDYDRYTCGAEYERAEREARSEKAGLWSEANPLPPWEFRRR
ncbi:MAG: thermonuclease family protein [Halieaceae bacterium]